VGQHERGLLLRVRAIQTRFQFMFGQIDEARRWLKAGVQYYTKPDDLRVSALALAAWLSLVQGAAEEWPPLLEQCRDTARAAGCLDTSPALLFAEATRVWLTVPERHQARASIDMFVRAGEQFAKAEQHGPHYMAVMFSAFSACFLGDRATATRLTKDLIAVAEAAEAPWCIAWAQWTCALLELLHGGDLHTAMAWVQSALDMAWKMGDTWLPAWGLWLGACIAAAMGQMEKAAFLFGGALQSQRRVRVLVEGLLPWWQVQQQAQNTIRQAQNSARTGLGDDLFEQHFQRGMDTDYDEVMTVALQPMPREDTQHDQAEVAPLLASLTAREHEVAEYLVEGWKNREIGDELHISERTVEVHVRSLFHKLGASGRVEVAVKFAALRHDSHREPAVSHAAPDTGVEPVRDGVARQALQDRT
jgi:non-specific serine/threonine protein kinase